MRSLVLSADSWIARDLVVYRDVSRRDSGFSNTLCGSAMRRGALSSGKRPVLAAASRTSPEGKAIFAGLMSGILAP